MKKLILSVAVLAALSTTSCKKAYECSCETSSTTKYASDMPALQSAIASANAQMDMYTVLKDKQVTTLDKTSKAEANATCADDEQTSTSYAPDYGDYDGDGNTTEVYYTLTTTTKTDCSLNKK